MKGSVTVSEKKEFISWFLNRYTLQKKEAAWLLSYLASNEQLLQKVHFVDDVPHLPKLLILSTRCSNTTSFKFIKNKRVGADVETAFYDIKLYPHEDLYISLYFKDRAICPEYAAVLEVDPMERYELAQDHLLSLFAEMFLDQAIKDFRQRELYRQIDDALAARDEEMFLQLSEEWARLLESSK